MTIETKTKEQLPWHPGFFAGIQIEFEEESDVQYVNTIKVEEITISYVSKKYPRKLIQHLKTVRGYQLIPQGNGIWYIEGGIFPMQLIVTSKLTKKENFWLKNLTNDLKSTSDAELLFTEYEKHKDSNLHKSVMNLIMKANKEVFKEARNNMCEALMELMEDVIEEKFAAGKLEGRLEELLELVSKKLAKGKTIEQIADDLEKTVPEIEDLIKLLESKS